MSKKVKASKVQVKNKKKKIFPWNQVLFHVKTLWNNAITIEVGRSRKWYWAILVGFLSILIALIPVAVNGSNINGSDIFNSAQYNIDISLAQYVKALENNQVSDITFDNESETSSILKVNNETKYLAKIDNSETLTKRKEEYGLVFYSEIPLYNPNDTQGDIESEGYKNYLNFEVYYVHDLENKPLANGGSKTFDSIVNEIEAINTNPTLNLDARNTSYLVIGSKNIEFGLYNTIVNPQSSQLLAVRKGDFKSFTFTKELNKDQYTLKNKLTSELTWNDNKGNTLIFKTFNDAYNYDASRATANLFNNFKTFMDEYYYNNKVVGAWTRVGIQVAINVGAILVFGLIIFLMSRGKNNPNNIIKFHESFGIATWASISPAILTMILSFILVYFEFMFFIALLGIRIMWMSMKNLRPTYQQ